MTLHNTVMNPPETHVVIGGHLYHVRKLGLRQTIQLSALAASLQASVRRHLTEQAEAGQADVVAIAEALSEDQVAKLLQILLKAPLREDEERFREITLEELSEVAAAVTDINNFGAIVKNFQKAAEGMKGITATLGTQPLPSLQQ